MSWYNNNEWRKERILSWRKREVCENSFLSKFAVVQERWAMPFEIRDVDRAFYAEHLAGWLLPRIIDVHAHVWLKTWVGSETPRGAQWPALVARDNSIEDLLRTYELMLPGQQVTPLIFGYPQRGADLEQANAYVSQVARRHAAPGLLLSSPEETAEELERRVGEGGFLGLKPYLEFAPAHIAADDMTIFDFLPHQHLQVADAHGWIVMLHIPRRARLRDPLNLAHMLEIERRYPHLRLIIAHVGRAYCVEDVGDALDVLGKTERMCFDFSANTNAQVIEMLLRAVGPRRVLFGSDLPIVRMRMRRICQDGVYINLTPPGLYGDLGGDPHMREVSREEGAKLSFFLYEELLALRRAAEAADLSAADLQDVFFNNAARLIAGAGGRNLNLEGGDGV
jgi:predicted TIM-barrel fold metal-dependent hydrolase